MRNILLVLLSLPIVIGVGGLAKYNIQLNKFVKQETNNPVLKSSNLTEVHIVGTVHFETDSIKRDHLYDYLDHISPTVILYEGDSSTVNRIAKKTDYFARFIDAFKKGKRVEKPVVLKYLKHNPNCILLPYEWEQRVKYHYKHKLRKKSKEMISLVIGLYLDSLLSKDQATIIEEFLELNKTSSKIDNGTLSDINNLTTDSIIKRRQQHYIYKEIPKIARNRKELMEYLDFVPIHMSYWDIRNKAMAQNILKQIEHHPNKTILVLTGYYHRHYLIEELKSYQTEYGFTLNSVEYKN